MNKTAEEMFKELGYEKLEDLGADYLVIRYEKNIPDHILAPIYKDSIITKTIVFDFENQNQILLM